MGVVAEAKGLGFAPQEEGGELVELVAEVVAQTLEEYRVFGRGEVYLPAVCRSGALDTRLERGFLEVRVDGRILLVLPWAAVSPATRCCRGKGKRK
jgi:hypothetical protein